MGVFIREGKRERVIKEEFLERGAQANRGLLERGHNKADGFIIKEKGYQ